MQAALNMGIRITDASYEALNAADAAREEAIAAIYDAILDKSISTAEALAKLDLLGVPVDAALAKLAELKKAAEDTVNSVKSAVTTAGSSGSPTTSGSSGSTGSTGSSGSTGSTGSSGSTGSTGSSGSTGSTGSSGSSAPTGNALTALQSRDRAIADHKGKGGLWIHTDRTNKWNGVMWLSTSSPDDLTSDKDEKYQQDGGKIRVLARRGKMQDPDDPDSNIWGPWRAVSTLTPEERELIWPGDRHHLVHLETTEPGQAHGGGITASAGLIEVLPQEAIIPLNRLTDVMSDVGAPMPVSPGSPVQGDWADITLRNEIRLVLGEQEFEDLIVNTRRHLIQQRRW